MENSSKNNALRHILAIYIFCIVESICWQFNELASYNLHDDDGRTKKPRSQNRHTKKNITTIYRCYKTYNAVCRKQICDEFPEADPSEQSISLLNSTSPDLKYNPFSCN